MEPTFRSLTAKSGKTQEGGEVSTPMARPPYALYVTRRIDCQKGRKLAMEDMCQLTKRLTENKYDGGSHKPVAKALLTYSANPGLDVVNYHELELFSFLTGDADMHLKNFSLLQTPGLGYGLRPGGHLPSQPRQYRGAGPHAQWQEAAAAAGRLPTGRPTRWRGE